MPETDSETTHPEATSKAERPDALETSIATSVAATSQSAAARTQTCVLEPERA